MRIAFVAALLAGLLRPATVADLDHSRWDALLERYITPESRVDYQGWKQNGIEDLDAYADFGSNWMRARAGPVKRWFLSLGERHGVNPIIFGSIYIGAIPFFSASIAWLIRNLRKARSIVAPVLCASFCFVSAYLYLIIAGRNIPSWAYLFIAGMLAFGVYATVRQVKTRLHESERGA